jgi:RNA polymerase sigma-70 factor (ECF subfamily)
MVRMGLPTESTDAALVVAIGRWDADAFAETYRRHAGPAYGLAWRILSDRHAAEEIVQEVFLRLWEHPERYEAERATLRTYLLVEIRGRCLDALRSRARRSQREERVNRLNPTEDYDLELEIWDLTLADQVRAALDSLSAVERRAIDLAYFGRRSYRDVAKVLGEPEGTVKGRIRAALGKLRERLTAEGIDAPWLDR